MIIKAIARQPPLQLTSSSALMRTQRQSPEIKKSNRSNCLIVFDEGEPHARIVPFTFFSATIESRAYFILHGGQPFYFRDRERLVRDARESRGALRTGERTRVRCSNRLVHFSSIAGEPRMVIICIVQLFAALTQYDENSSSLPLLFLVLSSRSLLLRLILY